MRTERPDGSARGREGRAGVAPGRRPAAPETGRVYRIADGSAELLDTSRDGRYLVFTLENGGTLAYTRAEEPHPAYRIAPIGAGVAGAAVIVLLLRRRKKKQSTPPEAESQRLQPPPAGKSDL